MQLENVKKENKENIAEDSHVLHFWQPCKFEINDEFTFVNDNLIFNTFSNLLYMIAYPLLLIINKFLFGFKIEGRENLENIDSGKITISNHVHPMDCTMVGLANVPNKTFFTSLETNFKIPIVRKIIKLLNAVPIPQNIKYTKKFVKSIDELIKNNKTVHFYPECSLWPHYEKIRHFKNGAFDFAVRNNVPIVPMVIKFNKPKKINNFIKTRTTITLIIQKPIYPNKLLGNKDAILDLKNRAYNSMRTEL